MYSIKHCPACHSTDITIKPTKLARFVAWRALDTPIDTDLDVMGLECNHCSFVGSVERFTEQEEMNLYKGYRGDEYNKIRLICEPSYDVRASFIEDSDGYYANRKIGITTILNRNVSMDSIKTVLDYGGDTGSLIPDILNHAQRFVYDISDAPTISGVLKYDKLAPDNIKTFDFLMCCHVLEHKPNPDDLLTDLKQYVNRDSWIYFEVPNNPRPHIGTFHEHINFFNIDSISALLDRNGFKVVDHYEYGFDCAIPCHKNNLCVITKLKD
jgi:SAM-dependent methyltransferase